MKMRYEKFGEEVLEVLLLYLQQHNKAVVYDRVGICGLIQGRDNKSQPRWGVKGLSQIFSLKL